MRSGRITLPLAPSGGIDRRGFCQIIAACAGIVAVPACTDGALIHTGPIGDDGGDDDQIDGPPGQIDAAPITYDASAAACTGGGQTDLGLPSAIAMGTATLFLSSRLFLVRDGGGLFAVSSQCTHRTSETLGVTAGHFRCPRHGAEFTFNGGIIGGPVLFGLVHYSLCMLGNGHVGVDTGMQVAASIRLNV